MVEPELLIDILLEGQQALVVGGGKVGERKTLQLLDAGAKITVVSKEFTEELVDLSRRGNVNLERAEVSEGYIVGLKFQPKVVIVALDDMSLNKKIAEEARSIGALVSVVDDPAISDFAMPAVAKVGDIRIGVSTRGSSPAMAGVIRRRVEKMITKKDLLQVELQKYARTLAKKHISSHEERRKVLSSIIENGEVGSFLEDGKMDEARNLAKNIIIQGKRSGK